MQIRMHKTVTPPEIYICIASLGIFCCLWMAAQSKTFNLGCSHSIITTTGNKAVNKLTQLESLPCENEDRRRVLDLSLLQRAEGVAEMKRSIQREPCTGQRYFLGSCVTSNPINTESCDNNTKNEWDAGRDFCLFYTSGTGIVEITYDRWKQAQSVESSVWNGNMGGEDRNEQHAQWFDGYKTLKPLAGQLGRMLEIGSGPFTQTKTIIERIGLQYSKVLSITLADPLMIFYHTHVPSCPYKDGSLLGFPTQFVASGGEELFFRGEYDTVIMMNVLEHCRDALKVLENMHTAVKPGGTLIFSERWYDTKWVKYEDNKQAFWDVMHPINVKRAIIESILSCYVPLYRRDFYYAGDYPTDEGVYFIGTRRIENLVTCSIEPIARP